MSDSQNRDLSNAKIVITGGAGLVGQNLLVKLRELGCSNLHVIDKAEYNLGIARELHKGVHFIEADMSRAGVWQDTARDADIAVLLHAQIGGIIPEDFYNNNVKATANLLDAISREAYLVHVSSSVVESQADDDYVASKAQQEELVARSGLPHSILRPTLMFGWFDRKHFGWLSQFMCSTPVFPIPGNGKFVRQPLYAGDFCEIILSCMRSGVPAQAYNISGKEKITYIDILRLIKSANGSSSLLLKIPYWMFYSLLSVYALFDRDPPFTTNQLKALVLDDVFEDIDWEGLFGVTATPLEQAIHQTFTDPVYSKVKLKF